MSELPDQSLVTVIIPAFNAEAYLADALESAMKQTWPNLEIIVVNDGSTDRTIEIANVHAARDGRVRVISQANGGLSAARNAGLAAATGLAVCFLDADDAYLPDKLGRQMELLARDHRCDLVYSDFYEGDRDLTPIALRSVEPIDVPMRQVVAYRTPFAPLSVLLRRSLVEATGAFDTSLLACEDRDYWIRAERHGRFCYLPGPVGIYRIHPGQGHRNLARQRAGQRSVVAKNFPRSSTEWGIAQACLAYSDARIAWGQRRLGRVAVGLLRSLMHARSWSRFRSVVRWGGYG